MRRPYLARAGMNVVGEEGEVAMAGHGRTAHRMCAEGAPRAVWGTYEFMSFNGRRTQLSLRSAGRLRAPRAIASPPHVPVSAFGIAT